jgi:hypothetical protein
MNASALRIVAVEPLRPGMSGTEQLVEAITGEIRRANNDPKVRDQTRDLALRVARNARPQDATAEIQAVWDYVTRLGAPPYRLDPVEAQIIAPAQKFDQLRGIDCKKYSIAAGALLEALGHPVQVRVIDQRPQLSGRGADFHHVYLLVFNRDTGEWLPFDPVARSFRDPSANVGTELPHHARRTYPMQTHDAGEALELVAFSGGLAGPNLAVDYRPAAQRVIEKEWGSILTTILDLSAEVPWAGDGLWKILFTNIGRIGTLDIPGFGPVTLSLGTRRAYIAEIYRELWGTYPTPEVAKAIDVAAKDRNGEQLVHAESIKNVAARAEFDPNRAEQQAQEEERRREEARRRSEVEKQGLATRINSANGPDSLAKIESEINGFASPLLPEHRNELLALIEQRAAALSASARSDEERAELLRLAQSAGAPKPMSTGVKVAIGVGVAGAVGGLVYLLTRRKRRRNPRRRRRSS